ncbi:MAG TPA: 30S ribosomal protein S17 [Candidatus Nanoarchaeia archaeon]|nr:30S ribosomal protein S17 [Candidatus Nanoarchaeia archaeon]
MAKKSHTTGKKAKTISSVAHVQQALSSRGRTFEGLVTKKFPTRIVIEFERTVYVRKYQRFYKKKTRLHARLPAGMDVNVGDYIRIRECRPLSKIIHFVVIEKVKSAESGKQEAKK